jgi:uncharacterized protein (TIGR03435 family)
LNESSDTVTCTCRLTGILARAYDVEMWRLVVPGWFRDQFYEIAAKLPSGTSKDQIPAMLRALLSERFHLETHVEPRATDVYALRVEAGGLKAKQSAPDAQTNPFGSMIFDRFARIYVDGKMPLSRLATILNGNMDRHVVDQTQTSGVFEIKLDARLPRPIDPSVEVPKELTMVSGKKISGEAPLIFSEIRKLGLILEPARLPLGFVVIDRINRIPSEN